MTKKTYLKLMEFQTEQSQRYLDEVRSIHTEMRGYKHDFHHHLQTLKGQLEAGEVERALAYIEQMDEQLRNVDTLLKTGNVSLDAVLSAKIAQATIMNSLRRKAGNIMSCGMRRHSIMWKGKENVLYNVEKGKRKEEQQRDI